ncbi:MAG: hypothetical protein BWX48_03039 [Verrucomicrobia bacterium ADurb.Bin006]|jgi:hypothetical protein|nr:MAG: hypothetical protein BWX48_03039 [Verrucomicrobia bacterium ADurb.Bin006]
MFDLNGTYVEDREQIGERGAVQLAKALWSMLANLLAASPRYLRVVEAP